MDNLRVARAVYALLLAFGYFDWMRIYPKLPQRIAVHFAYDGTPNGWAPKDGVLWTTLIVLAILSVTTMGISRLIAAVPDDRMNLPHRAYWLAPERRKQTMGFIEVQGIWFGCAVLLLVYTAFQLAVDANLSPDKRFNSNTMWNALGVFFFVVAVWMIHFVRHFYRVPDDTLT
jgi:Protein of unknown function (DUF1648)